MFRCGFPYAAGLETERCRVLTRAISSNWKRNAAMASISPASQRRTAAIEPPAMRKTGSGRTEAAATRDSCGLNLLRQTRTETRHRIAPAMGLDADHPASRQAMQAESASLPGKEAQIMPPLIEMTCPEI
jgi:hypothetical protein